MQYCMWNRVGQSWYASVDFAPDPSRTSPIARSLRACVLSHSHLHPPFLLYFTVITGVKIEDTNPSSNTFMPWSCGMQHWRSKVACNFDTFWIFCWFFIQNEIVATPSEKIVTKNWKIQSQTKNFPQALQGLQEPDKPYFSESNS